MAATALPSSADIARAEDLTRERFLHEGEDPAVALAPATPRRRALDGALAELADGRTQPSRAWRLEFSLLLGLERVLSDDEPKLVDGTVLSAHQVDALSGTLTALLAEAQRSNANGNGNGNGKAAVDVLAAASILGIEDEEDPGLDDADMATPEPDEEDDEDEDDDDDFAPSAAGEDEDEDDEDDDVAAELEAELDRAELEAPPDDWDDEDEPSQDGDDQLPEQEDDPNAAKRFWFEHATGAGKTVAALGFVEA
ncbi:MAG: hypothetical protein LC720_08495, partial [Actinobacteria bacterium]|nr:hypothetical protein [Actinomycetota bacterium]